MAILGRGHGHEPGFGEKEIEEISLGVVLVDRTCCCYLGDGASLQGPFLIAPSTGGGWVQRCAAFNLYVSVGSLSTRLRGF